MKSQHPNTAARQAAVQFLYQCEADNIYYFSIGHFERFLNNFEIPQAIHGTIQNLVLGTLDQLQEIDGLIEKNSKNWKVTRMGATDRATIRLATYELIGTETPTKVIINEAVEIAKLFGTDKSGAFVNGIIDSVASKVRTKDQNASSQ